MLRIEKYQSGQGRSELLFPYATTKLNAIEMG